MIRFTRQTPTFNRCFDDTLSPVKESLLSFWYLSDKSMFSQVRAMRKECSQASEAPLNKVVDSTGKAKEENEHPDSSRARNPLSIVNFYRQVGGQSSRTIQKGSTLILTVNPPIACVSNMPIGLCLQWKKNC